MEHTPDLAADLATFAATIALGDLPEPVVAATQANILDTLACALAGSSAPGVAEVRALVEEWGGAEQATTWVFGRGLPAHVAAWQNGVMAHARDYDDTHDAAILHAGVSTVPAAIAAAQLSGTCTGADLIAAITAGLEVTCRLGAATKVDLITSGFIYSSLLGYFGATAAAGRAMGLNASQMHDAFGIVYSSVAGNHQVTRDASLMKRMQPGLAAQGAVVAVQLASRGIRGARGVFEGDDGFIRVYLNNQMSAAEVREGLGERFEMLNLSYKPYPCCRDTHSTIDAVLDLREAASQSTEEIVSITVGTTAGGYQMVCVPEAVRLAPRTVVEAQFSIPYTAAAAWIDGSIGLDHFTQEGLMREDILALAAKVRPYVHEGIEAEWSRFVPPALVQITFRDGSAIEQRADFAKGHPRHPMTPAEIKAKVQDCAHHSAVALPGDIAVRLSEAVATLPGAPDVRSLVAAMT